MLPPAQPHGVEWSSEPQPRRSPGVPERRIALGVGLTNGCNLSCAHCYRATGSDRLSVDDVLRAVDALPTRAVNFGTGESGLHPDFAEIVEALVARGVAVTMTTNGHSAAVLPDAVLALFRDVEFSIDYPDQRAHDEARGAGNWALVEEQMGRCKRLGVSTAIVAVMMAPNHLALPDLARLADARGALLRVNVYQALRRDAFTMTYAQFWAGWRAALEVADLVACGEPILRAVLGIPRAPGAGCGVETVRVSPRGRVLPCVYGNDPPLDLDDLERLGPAVVDEPLFAEMRTPPAACAGCPALDNCGGGCASRRAASGGLDRPDPYCPVVRGDEVTLRPPATAEGGRDVSPKASSACTTLLRLRKEPTS